MRLHSRYASGLYAKFASYLAWIDIIFNFMMAMSFLFIYSTLLIHPDENPNKANVEMKAEYIITMQWPDHSLDDIDLWVLLPDGSQCYFRNANVEHCTLDRDDRGVNNTYWGADDKQHMTWYHKEITTLRAISPGHYIVNVHVFKVNPEFQEWKATDTLPYPVTVTLTKLNPVTTEIVRNSVVVEKVGQQRTAFSFDIEKDGTVTNIDKDTDVPWIDILEVMPQQGTSEQEEDYEDH